MGVGLYLTGRYGRGGLFSRAEAPRSWLERAEAWIQENSGETLLMAHQGQDPDGRPALLVQLHPAAEEVWLIGVGGGAVHISAKTSTVGPGYHVYVCDLLRGLGSALGVTWDPPNPRTGVGDETGYFQTTDPAAVEREMLAWLKQVAHELLHAHRQRASDLQLGMASGHIYRHDGVVATPMGPRDLAWAEAVAADPHRGIDLFPWWQPGQGASYDLGRALCRMWTDVRWRPPLEDVPAEAELLTEVAGLLTRAYQDDPTLSYPWKEWAEIHDFLGTDGALNTEVARRGAETPEGMRIGYRRQPVRVRPTGGWWIEVPGSFAESWGQDGSWSAWEPPRWVSFFSVSATDPRKPRSAEEMLASAPPLPEGERLEYRAEEVIGQAVLSHALEEGRSSWNLIARSAVPREMALCYVTYENPSDRQWALDTWHSLEHGPAVTPA
jgi:hypothetical protein